MASISDISLYVFINKTAQEAKDSAQQQHPRRLALFEQQ